MTDPYESAFLAAMDVQRAGSTETLPKLLWLAGIEHANAEVPGYAFGQPAPSAFVQWKGTEVCADIHCTCGHHSHIDDMFAYNVRCPACSKLWEMPHNLPLREGVDDAGPEAEGVDPLHAGDHRQLYLDNAAVVLGIVEELAGEGNRQAVAMLAGLCNRAGSAT